MRYRFVARAAALVAITVAAVIARSNASVGIWKIKIATSTFSDAAPTGGIINVEPAVNGAKYAVDTSDANGMSPHWERTTAYDVISVPITGNRDSGPQLPSNVCHSPGESTGTEETR